jgi:lactoylglutathione lyase
MPRREDIDAIADKARANGSLAWEPRYVSEHVGYVCAVNDPDGNVIEFSYDQRVFSTIQKLWGNKEEVGASTGSEASASA